MITLLYACSLTILALVLSFLTGRQRFKTETNLGLGDDFGMLQITRAHGNLLENALFFLILLFLLETVGQISNTAIIILGALFLLARIAHAYEQEIYLQDGSKMIPDFMAITPKGNVYIEFWGMEGKTGYDKRREAKKRLYKDNGLELVEIFPKHLDKLDAYLNAVFARYGVKTAF